MRYVLAILILSIPLGAFALSPASRFDWQSGRPNVAADSTSDCTGASTVRFDWSAGQPMVVHDSTATCEGGGGGGTPTVSSHLYIKDGNALYIKNGNSFYIKQ